MNYKINIDKLNKKYYNKGDDTIIQIFTYKDYLKYRKLIEKKEVFSLAEESEEYYLQSEKEDKIKIKNGHDKIFRKLLYIKSETAKFVNEALELTEEKLIKEDDLEKYTNRFITENLKDKESDVIYKVKNRNVFILIEHQTQIDYKMPIRMIEYSLGIIKSSIDYKKIMDEDYEMPSVIPIVLYTGNTKWKAKRSISEKQSIIDGKSEWKSTKYNLVDVNNYTEDELIKEKTYISKVMLLEKHRNTEELTRYLKAIVEEVVEHKNLYSKEAEETFVILIRKIFRNKIGDENTNEIIKKLKGVDENMLTCLMTIERENKMIFSNGRKEGIKEGKKEGKELRNIEIIKNMISEKLPIELISKITGKTQEEIKKIQKK